jgi:hypothetical protein
MERRLGTDQDIIKEADQFLAPFGILSVKATAKMFPAWTLK